MMSRREKCSLCMSEAGEEEPEGTVLIPKRNALLGVVLGKPLYRGG